MDLLLSSSIAARARIELFNTARREDATRSLPQKLAYQLGSCARFAATIAELRPRIVHIKTVSNLNFYQNALYTLLARLLGRRVLLQIHGGGFRDFYERSGHLQRYAIRTTLRQAHLLVALSDGWARYFRNISGGRSVFVIPNGTITSRFRSASPQRSAFRIGQDRVAMLFLGTREDWLDVLKGVEELIQAVAVVRERHPELLLVAAGKACAERLAASPDLGPEGEAWVGVGVVDSQRKASLYRSVDFFVLPSHIENMPNTLIEAMAAGLPAVASSIGAIPEMIEDGETGFVIPPKNARALADCIERLVVDRDLRMRMGDRAAGIAAERFDLSAVQSRLLEAYGRLDEHYAVEPDASICRLGCRPAPIAWYRREPVQGKVRLLSRLMQMSPFEIAHRTRRILSKRITRRRRDATDGGRGVSFPLPAVMDAHPGRYLGTRPAPHGWFELAERDRIAARARAHLPEQIDSTLLRADRILSEGVDLLGKRFRPADADFDWLADPDHGRLWPLTALDDGDAVRRVRADVKFVWEVNRHQFLVTLARAYRYSMRGEYVRACVRIVEGWIAANPAGRGVNWASNLEVAVRSLSWVWSLHFLLGARELDDSSLRRWLISLGEHRDHLVRHLSTYTDPTNHLIGEVAALAVLSIWLPEWERSEEYREVALQKLERELSRQVAGDGVSREQSTSYQRFVLDFVLQVVAIAERNGVSLAPPLRSQARAMIAALRELVGESHRAPRIGDGDEARGLPFFDDDPWDFADIIALGETLLGDPRCEPRRRNHESLLWLAGASVDLSRGAPAPEPTRASVVLREGGYAILRSSAARSDRLVFDCGPLGLPPHASHGHADLLSVLADVDGEEVLIDPGTFAYYDADGRRNLFRSTRSHNTVEVGGRDQADPFDPFKWLNVPRTGLSAVRLGRDFEYVEAWHDGYRRLESPVRHRRAVAGFRGSWLLIDWLEGSGSHHFARWFHVPPSVRVDRLDPVTVRLVPPSGRRALLVRDLRAEGDSPSLLDCIAGAPYSERYGQLASAPAVAFTDHTQLPALRVTLLAPHDAHCEPPVSARIEGSRMDRTLRIVLGIGTPTLDLRLRAFASSAPPDAQARAVIVHDDGIRPVVLRSLGDDSVNRFSER